jgi:competence protein ComGC
MSATIGGSSAAPNWYPDPGDARFLRYWDGTQWTEHTSPAAPVGAPPVPGAPGGGRSSKTLWIVLASVVGGLVVVVLLVAAAIPVFLSQREKAQDAATKADVSTLGIEINVWYVDHNGAPPAVETRGGYYYVDGVMVAPVSANVVLGGQTGSGENDWCVWVTNPAGALKDFRYSAAGGLDSGTC